MDISEIKCDCTIEDVLRKRFRERSYFEKEDIIKIGRPIPTLGITSKAKTFTRSFRPVLYTNIPWLCGCEKLQKVFCWPCLLFSDEINTWTKSGFCDLNNLSKARKRHENSKCHIESFLKLKLFGKQQKTKPNFNQQQKTDIENHNKNVEMNRYIISKLIDAICFSSKLEMALQNCVESSRSNNRGDYIELVHLLSTADSQLKFYLEKSKLFSQSSNTSNKSLQNDLICSIGNVLLQEIKREIDSAQFVSIIVSETADNCHMSTVFRYVNKTGDVREKFVGFRNLSENFNSDLLYIHMMEYLREFRCTEKKLVSQTYDGAVLMPGTHKCIQRKIKEIYKNAMFVHCYAHRFNLVISQTVNFIKECKIFFQVLSKFSLFFSKSPTRSYAFQQEIWKHFPFAPPNVWTYNSRIVDYIKRYKFELKEMLIKMFDWDAGTATAARGLYHYLTDFNFNFLLEVFSPIFSKSTALHNILKDKTIDMKHSVARIVDFIKFLIMIRNNFSFFWESVENVENSSDIPTTKKSRPDCSFMEESCRRLFFEIIDTLIYNCNDRFSEMNSLRFVSLINVNNFKKYSEKFPESQFNCLKEAYGNFFDVVKLKHELEYVYGCSVFKNKSLDDVKTILIRNELNQDVLKEFYNLVILICSMPVFDAPMERTISKVKRIHKFLSNEKEIEMLSFLTLILIEKQLLNSLKQSETSEFYERVMRDFEKRRSYIDLTYKEL